MRVEVSGTVYRVVETVQSLARVGVEAARLDLHHVLSQIEDGQGDAGAVPGHRGRLTVNAE